MNYKLFRSKLWQPNRDKINALTWRIWIKSLESLDSNPEPPEYKCRTLSIRQPTWPPCVSNVWGCLSQVHAVYVYLRSLDINYILSGSRPIQTWIGKGSYESKWGHFYTEVPSTTTKTLTYPTIPSWSLAPAESGKIMYLLPSGFSEEMKI
jgi:hypothetical protein